MVPVEYQSSQGTEETEDQPLKTVGTNISKSGGNLPGPDLRRSSAPSLKGLAQLAHWRKNMALQSH